jgi:hypothetical protein
VTTGDSNVLQVGQKWLSVAVKLSHVAKQFYMIMESSQTCFGKIMK